MPITERNIIRFISLLYVCTRALQSLPDEIKDGKGIAADEAADRLTPTVYTARYRINVVLAVDTEIDTPVRALAVRRDLVFMCGCGSPILYIVHSESDTISVVDMQSLQTKKLITLEGNADHIACNPGLNRAYAAVHDARKVAVIDGYTYEVAEYVELNGEPSCIAVDETADRLYVSCPDGGKIYVLGDTP